MVRRLIKNICSLAHIKQGVKVWREPNGPEACRIFRVGARKIRQSPRHILCGSAEDLEPTLHQSS